MKPFKNYESTQTFSSRPTLPAGGYVCTVPAMTVAELLKSVTAGAAVIGTDGKTVSADKKLGTGMRIAILEDGKIVSEKTVIIQGDIDGDGNISAADARLALRVAVKLDVPTEVQSFAGLVDGALAISSAEARIILRAAVGLEKAAGWLAKIK